MTDLARRLDLSAVDAIPPEAAPLIRGLIEGTIKQMVVIFETSDGNFCDCFPILDDDCNRYAMLGAIEVLKRDYMRSQIEARVNYAPAEDDADNE